MTNSKSLEPIWVHEIKNKYNFSGWLPFAKCKPVWTIGSLDFFFPFFHLVITNEMQKMNQFMLKSVASFSFNPVCGFHFNLSAAHWSVFGFEVHSAASNPNFCLEPVCCKNRWIKVPTKKLVWGIGDIWRLWMIQH